MTRRIRNYRILPLLAGLLAAACGGGGSTGPDEEPPTITVAGVADGVQYTGSVTVTISVDRGSYEAALNGSAVVSGFTVATPGAYQLVVTARNGVATATDTINFSIANAPGGALIVRMLNLGANAAGGGGDAILITDSSAAGQVHALIDAGPAGANASDPGYVARRLRELGVDTLQFMQLTHAHSDHFQGMTDVLNSLKVRRFYYNGQVRNLSFYNTLLNAARARADTVIAVTDTVPLAFGIGTPQTRLTILTPLPTYIGRATEDADELNNGSLGTSLRRGSWEMFFTGDGEGEANHRWRTQFAPYTDNLDVLKVGHHGANNAIFDNGTGFGDTSSAWLTHTNPRVSIISANGTSHPRLRALNRLLQQTTMDTYCTNVHGEITIRVWADGNSAVTVERNAASDCVKGSEATT